MRRAVGTFLRGHVYGRAAFRPLFSSMYRYGVAGLYTVGDGTYAATGEAAAIRAIAARLPERPIVVDVGANVGLYTEMLLGVLPDASVHCFEPAPEAYAQLRRRLGGRDRVRLYPLALGDRADRAPLYVHGDDVDEYASLHASRAAPTRTVEVEVQRLDSLVEAVDFLKIDAEGHDLAVLHGAGRLIDGLAAVQFEFSDANIASRTFMRDFYEFFGPDFSIARVTRDGLVPLGEYQFAYEVFVPANYVALRG